MHHIVDDYDMIVGFKEWLDDHHISIPALNAYNENTFRLASNKLNIAEISALLHVDFLGNFKKIQEEYMNKLHVLFIPGIDQEPWGRFELRRKDIVFHQITDGFTSEDLTFFDPFPGFMHALIHAEEWPGALIFTDDRIAFFKMNSVEDIDKLNDLLDGPDLFDHHYDHYSYYFHLSDLHLSARKKSQIEILDRLLDSIDFVKSHTFSPNRYKFWISGDLMDTPSRSNMYFAQDFMNAVRKRYRADVQFVLGNHDMIRHGVNIAGRQKTKVIAYLLGEKLKLYEDDKIMLIKVDSNSSGNFARGMVGERQMDDIDDEIESVIDADDYTKVVMLHHHVCKISRPEFLKKQWNEGAILGQLEDASKALVDGHAFNRWMDTQNVKYVIHGHKHVPFFVKEEDRYVISAGSGTGNLKEMESKYISYNVLKYDPQLKEMKNCLIIYEDKKKAERQRVAVCLFKENSNE